MNILLVSSDNNKTSGAFLSLVELAVNLETIYGYKVFVILPKYGDGISLLEEHQINYKIIPTLSWIVYNNVSIKSIVKYCIKGIGLLLNVISILYLCFYIYKHKIDIVHNNTIFTYVGAVASKIMKKSLVWHIREDIEHAFSSKLFNNRLGYKLINSSNRIIFVSNYIQSMYTKYIDTTRCVVIYDGIDTSFYKVRPILTNNLVNIAIIGHLNRNKNQIELIGTLHNLLRKRVTNFHLHIIGDGELRSELEEYVKYHNMDSYVSFYGRRSDLHAILDMVDVVVSCSKSEAFGRTLIEAMLHGCLVISSVSENNASNEIIESGVTGLLYPLGHMSKLEYLLESILSNSHNQVYTSYAKKGQKIAFSRFTTNKTVENIQLVYSQVIRDISKYE